MTFLSCNSPKNDGERIAEMYNKSVSDFIDEREKTFDGFISDFESYNFSSRVEARNEIESAIDKLVSEYDNDRASADYAYEKLAREYSGDFDKYNEFITDQIQRTADKAEHEEGDQESGRYLFAGGNAS